MKYNWNETFNTGPFASIFPDSKTAVDGWYPRVTDLLYQGVKPTYTPVSDESLFHAADVVRACDCPFNIVWIKIALTAGVPVADIPGVLEDVKDFADFRGNLGDYLGVSDTHVFPLVMCVARESAGLIHAFSK